MLYFFAKMIMTPAVTWYFRKRFFCGEERIPRSGPVVLLGSHSASFLDAIVMGVMMKRPIHFYVRGDIFRKPVVRWIFSRLHMIPVFSADLAKQDLLRNAASFDIGAKILSAGGVLLIFPEGQSRLERNLMPFRKSPARIILQALELDQSLHIHVVPIGIHFSEHRFRGDLNIVTGGVIQVSAQSIAQLLKEDDAQSVAFASARSISLLTRSMREAFEKVVLYVEQDNRSRLLEQELILLDTDWPGLSEEKFLVQRKICRSISELNDVASIQHQASVENYFHFLQRMGLCDRGFSRNAGGFVKGVFLILTFPAYFVGRLFHFIPYRLGKYMADTRVTRDDFYTSVQLAVSAISNLLWMLILLLISLVSDWDVLLGLVLIAPLLGLVAELWDDRYREWTAAWRLRDRRHQEVIELRKCRAELRQQMQERVAVENGAMVRPSVIANP